MTRNLCHACGPLLACFIASLWQVWVVAEEAPEQHRWEAAIEGFESADRENSPEPGQILFTGSSTIRLWNLEQHFPDIEMLNRGFGGSTIEDLNHFFDRVVVPYQPRAVVFYSGDNDISRNQAPEEVIAAFESFRAKLRGALPNARLYVLSIKPSTARWEMWPEMQQVNVHFTAEAEKDPLLHYVDTATPMLGEDGAPRADYLLDDGLHLNEAGYAVWSALLRDALAPEKAASSEP